MGKSGTLVFCAGETQVYTIEQLMRASAELLGRGSLATTYKAMLDDRLIACVKRLDAARLAGTSKEMFERHMEEVKVNKSKAIALDIITEDVAQDDMVKWVKLIRDSGGGDAEDNRLVMLVEVAVVCRVSSPEQRPTMWQVLKMIQEIKEAAVTEEVDGTS
ncbi:hypothetical protein L1987_51556 [Smallanthus sonchifolius]|uniref:Uncharacterized protein n=1 Tax=Smallanthus sonchifolius TaxID=185202 RepID=A0ACB9ERE3_9ASTR|nr:hypothetical protein L1987_51556 [Smallanthus sonchifolius]